MTTSGYRYLDDVATADAAVEAWGSSPEELLLAACDATLNVMVADLGAIAPRERRELRVDAESLDLLLFELLQELVYYKDAEQLLLRPARVTIQREPARLRLVAEAWGEVLDPGRHELLADVKAVTLYRLRVWEEEGMYRATVVLDT